MRLALRKWYLDATFPDGSAWIGYSALLRIGPFPALRWSAVFDARAAGVAVERARWGRSPEPAGDPSGFRWSLPGAGGGRWESADPSLEAGPAAEQPAFETLLADDSELRAHWRCVAPRARVVLADGRVGTGYVEEMRLDLPRMRLPFRDLWWGRAHAGGSSLVWIRWGFGRDLTLILRDGRPVAGEIEADDEGGVRIELGGDLWIAQGGRILRDRDLRGAFPHWLVRATGALPMARECKRTGVVQRRRGGHADEGRGIWEVVRWS